MGSGSSSQQQFEKILQDYKQIGLQQDPQYGDIQVMVNFKTQEQVAAKEIIFQPIEEHQCILKLIEFFIKQNHPNFLKVFSYSKIKEEQVCSSVTRLIWILEYTKRDLEQEYKDLLQKNQKLAQDEMWNLFSQIVTALAFLQKNNFYHGDIRASQIFLSSQPQLTYKLAIPSLLHVNSQYIQIISSQYKSGMYLSPQLLDQLSLENWIPTHNKYKSDVFSLGMVILEVANSKSLDDLYNYEKFTIDWNKLDQNLLQLQESYGKELYDIVKGMVTIDEAGRKNFTELEEVIRNSSHYYRIIQQTSVKDSNYIAEKINNPYNEVNNENFKIQNLSQEIHLHSTGKQQIILQTNKRNTEQEVLQLCNTEAPNITLQFSEKGKNSPDQNQQYFSVQQTNQNLDVDFLKHQPTFGANQKILVPDQYLNVSKTSDQIAKKSQQLEINTENSNSNFIQALGNINVHSNNQDYKKQDQKPIVLSPNSSTKIKNSIISPQHKENTYKPVELDKLYYHQNTHNPPQANIESNLKPSNYHTLPLKNSNSKPVTYSQYTTENQDPAYHKSSFNYQPEYLHKSNIQLNPSLIGRDQSIYPPPSQDNYTSVVQTRIQKNEQLSDEQLRNMVRNEQYQNYNAIIHQPQDIQKQLTESQRLLSSQKPLVQEVNYQQYEQSANELGSKLDQILLRTSVYQGNKSQQEVNQPLDNNKVVFVKPQEQQQFFSHYDSRQLKPDTEKFIEEYSKYQTSNNNQIISSITKPLNNQIYSHTDQLQLNQISEQKQFPYGKTSQEFKYQTQQQFQQPEIEIVTENANQNYGVYEKIQETYEDGSQYNGEKLNGQRHGQGVFYYNDGGHYEGQWVQGRMEGYGTLYYPSGGLAYMGQWYDDKFNGKGTVFNETPQQLDEPYDYGNFDLLGELWTKYDGEFRDDNKEGIGSLYLSNGEKYVGQFLNDLVHGQGAYYLKNNQVVQGIWQSNRLAKILE